MADIKSQAAMEFLMSYGWALLAVISVIAVLAFTGLLNLNRFLPDKVEIGPGIGVIDFEVKQNNITLIVKNNLGTPIRNLRINASRCSNSLSSISAPVDIAESESRAISITCSNAGLPGNKLVTDLFTNYSTMQSAPRSFSHYAKGKLVSSITGNKYLAIGAACAFGINCGTGYCDTFNGICSTGAVGERASSAGDCQSGYYYPGTNICTTGEVGSLCSSNADCQSNSCNVGPDTCN